MLARPHFMPVWIIAALLLVLGTGPHPVDAHMGAKGVVMERMETMKTIAKAMKAVSLMTRGKTAFEGDRVAASARTIAEHGARIVTLFPKGSGGGVSEAGPAIWADPEGFERMAGAMTAAARGLRDAAKTDDESAVTAAFRRLGRSCSDCHKDYRVKKKKRP